MITVNYQGKTGVTLGSTLKDMGKNVEKAIKAIGDVITAAKGSVP